MKYLKFSSIAAFLFFLLISYGRVKSQTDGIELEYPDAVAELSLGITADWFSLPLDTRFIVQQANFLKFINLQAYAGPNDLLPRIYLHSALLNPLFELSYPVGLIGDNYPPIITNLSTSILDADSVRVTWFTDEVTDAQIEYGAEPGVYTNDEYDPLYYKRHDLILDNLTTCTEYYYRITSTDRSGNDANQEGNFITYCPPTVALSSASYSVDEAAASATITVNLSDSSEFEITVDFSTSDGTASAGSDYIAMADPLTFTPGDVHKTIEVIILEDLIYDPIETVILTLSNPFNATLGTPSTATLTISEQDVPLDSFNKLSPANGAVNQSIIPTLTWESTTPVTRYEYCYDSILNNSCTSWTSVGTNTSMILPPLSYSTSYEWHVRAYNEIAGPIYSNGSATAFWTFLTRDSSGGSINIYLPLQIKDP
jgi:hypothetical protein